MSDPETIISRAVALGGEGVDRQHAADELVRLSTGRRALLESARDHFVDRLHKDSADHDATLALQIVNTALNQVARSTGADE